MRTITMVFPVALLIVAACNSSENGDSQSASALANSQWTPPEVNCPEGCTVVNPSAPHVVYLDAAQVIGASMETGNGHGELTLDRNSGAIGGTISLDGVNATEVTLNRGYAGENGPVLVRLNQTGDSEWSLPPTSSLSVADIAAMDSGGLYVDVTSALSPGGAIRGQVIRRGAVLVYFFTLFGSQVVPAVTSSATATGTITLRADVAASGIVGGNEDTVLHVNLHGLDQVTSVHVHDSLAGINGPVIVDLAQDTVDPSHWYTRQSLFDEGAKTAFRTGFCVAGGCDQTLYLDVHTGSHPDGELRAQLGFPQEVQFVSLTGDDAVPSVQSNRFGTVATTITDIVGWEWTLELTMNVTLEEISDATSVTLNYAPVGQNGPVIYSLERDPDRLNHWFGTTLLDEPVEAVGHGWYFTVTTPSFPGGELRGQWETQYNQASYNSGWSGEAFEVSTVNPPDGSTIASLPNSLIVKFTDRILTSSVGADNIDLLASGGDGKFRDGNELRITPLDVRAVDSTLTIEIGQNMPADDVYQLIVHGIKAGYADNSPAPGFLSTFAVDSSHPSPTFAQLQQEIFTPNCAQAGCHGGARPAFGLNLSPGVSYDNIVDFPSAGEPGLDIVEPGDPEASFIIRKLFQPWWDPHPAGQPRLSNAAMQRLRQWIAEGAKDN